MARDEDTEIKSPTDTCSPEEEAVLARFNRRTKRATERALETAKFGAFTTF